VSLAQVIGGFALGYLLARGVRVVLTIAGFLLLILAALQMAGYVTVNWSKIESDLGALVTQLGSGTITLDQLKDYLPGAAGLVLGLLTGSGALGSLLRRGPRLPYG
jgi:uncharacterized membrane protein (Fun14 family)